MMGNARWVWLAAAAGLGIVGLALLLWLRTPIVPTPIVPTTSGSATRVVEPPAAAAASAESAGRGAAPDDPSAFDGVAHTELPLRLLATVVRENRRRSLAAVEDEEQGGSQILTEGSFFEHHRKAKLTHIERSRILIDNDGVREQLVFDRTPIARSGSGPGGIEPSREEVERQRELSDQLRELLDAVPYDAEADAEGDYLGGLLAQGDVQPLYEDGEMIGIGIDGVREGGLYDQLGLRNGDLVTSINGVPLGGPTATAELLAEFALSDRWTFTVDRSDGTQDTLSVPTADLAQRIEQLE